MYYLISLSISRERQVYFRATIIPEIRPQRRSQFLAGASPLVQQWQIYLVIGLAGAMRRMSHGLAICPSGPFRTPRTRTFSLSSSIFFLLFLSRNGLISIEVSRLASYVDRSSSFEFYPHQIFSEHLVWFHLGLTFQAEETLRTGGIESSTIPLIFSHDKK